MTQPLPQSYTLPKRSRYNRVKAVPEYIKENNNGKSRIKKKSESNKACLLKFRLWQKSKLPNLWTYMFHFSIQHTGNRIPTFIEIFHRLLDTLNGCGIFFKGLCNALCSVVEITERILLLCQLLLQFLWNQNKMRKNVKR